MNWTRLLWNERMTEQPVRPRTVLTVAVSGMTVFKYSILIKSTQKFQNAGVLLVSSEYVYTALSGILYTFH